MDHKISRLLLGSLLVSAVWVWPSSAALPVIRVASDGRSFMTADGQPFSPMGVNYFRPGTGWAPKVWKQFDPAATRQDFKRLKDLGVNCVRVFLTYGSFYTEPGVLNPEGLEKLDSFLSLAEAAGIYVHPTGPDHWEGLPEWARQDRMADEAVLQHLETFWQRLAARYKDRPVLFAYDLLNEPAIPWDSAHLRKRWNGWLTSQYGTAAAAAQAWGIPVAELSWGQVPAPAANGQGNSRQLLDYQHFRESVADEWTRRQAAAIKAADSNALVTVGLIQWSVPTMLPGIQQYSAFKPARQARYLDFLEIHFYPLAQGFYEYTSAEAGLANRAYLESVVREVAAPGKPVVIAEFGWYGGGKLTIDNGKHPPATEEQQAAWNRSVIETTRGLAVGWLNWGFYDHPEARDVTQLTGLLTADGKVKAWGREFQRIATELQGQKSSPRPLSSRPALDWDLVLTNSAAARRFLETYVSAYRQQTSR